MQVLQRRTFEEDVGGLATTNARWHGILQRQIMPLSITSALRRHISLSVII
jgi:hypothetical protein